MNPSNDFAKEQTHPLRSPRVKKAGIFGILTIVFLIPALYVYNHFNQNNQYSQYNQSDQVQIYFLLIIPTLLSAIIGVGYLAKPLITRLVQALPPTISEIQRSRVRKWTYTICMLGLTLGSGFGMFAYFRWLPTDLTYLPTREEQAEFAILRARFEEELWQATPDPGIADELAARLIETPEGRYFEDVDYDSDVRAAWPTRAHLSNLYTMIAYYGQAAIQSNSSLRAMLVDTLEYWLYNDFQSLNWWYNEISTPEALGNIGIMMKPFLTVRQILDIRKIVERGTLSYQEYHFDQWSGANLMDAVENTVRYAFFMEQPYLLKKAMSTAAGELTIYEGDEGGIKPDYTFYQHGIQQAIASYGVVFVSGVVNLARLCNGTSFQFSEEELSILVDFLLEGQQYAYRGYRSNYLTNGRSFSRKNGNSGNMKPYLEILLRLDNIPRAAELQKYYDSFDDPQAGLTDTKYFPYAHTLFVTSPEYYMAVKGAYEGFINSELVNSENILGRNLGYGGVTTFQYTGEEYDNISALWDFALLPGTTAFYETDAQLWAYTGNGAGYRYRSSTTHSQGLSNGTLGALYVDIENEEGLFSRQAYISYQDLMVCLGTGITCTSSTNTKEIFTTINQVYADNAAYQGSLLTGSNTISDSAAILNGQFAYYNLGDGELTATVENVTGDLNRNNLAASGTYSADILTLSYSHGLLPENNSFVYVVKANANHDAPTEANGLPITEIINTYDLQRVEFLDGTTVQINHQTGEILFSNGFDV